MQFDTLYHKGSSGALYSWRVWTEGADVCTEYGQIDGKKQLARKTADAKNVDKSNATTPEEQAVAEAKSMWTHRVERKYRRTIDEAKNDEIFLPMLASEFEKRRGQKKDGHTYPCDVQPKLDGCVYGSTVLTTSDGPKTIQEIVEGRLSLEVLSYNESKEVFEFKRVVGWFNNGYADHTHWLDVVPEFGNHIKCTSDHKFLTPSGWKEARDLDPKCDLILSFDDSSYFNSLLAGTLLGDSMLVVEKRGSGTSYRSKFAHTNKEFFEFKKSLLGLTGSSVTYTSGFGSRGKAFISSALTSSTFPISRFYHTGHSPNVGKRKVVYHETLRELLSPEALALWIGDDGSIQNNNGDPTTPRLYLHTHSSSEDQIEEYRKYFRSEWDCTPSVYTDKVVEDTGNVPGKFLCFSTKDTLWILNKLRTKHCKGVEYKFYFPTEGYVRPVTKGPVWQRFHVRHAKFMPVAAKYDIEVEDNHTYVANGHVIHNCRALAYWDGEDLKLLSRGGKEYNCPHIISVLKNVLPPNLVLDGELYLHGVGFQTITSWVKKLQANTSKIQYHVYDCVLLNDRSASWVDRYHHLYAFFNTSSHRLGDVVHLVETYEAHNEDEILRIHNKVVSKGYEGAIVRMYDDSKYQFAYRSKRLLKVKSFNDSEYEVVGYTTGKGKFADCAVWICKAGDNTFQVVSMGSMEERKRLLQEAESYVGCLLKVKYFDLTDDGIPRFPVGIGFRMEEDMS